MSFTTIQIAVTLFLFCLSAGESFAQETPKAILLDEFGAMPCEHLLGRTDALAAELDKEPGSVAAILILPGNSGPHATASRRRLIIGTLQLLGVPPNRFATYIGKQAGEGQIQTQYWKLPVGTTPSFSDATLWTEAEQDTSRPFIFGYEDEIGICPTFVPKNFARLLLENPGSRGHIVVRSGIDSGYVNRFFFANEWIKELVEKQGIPRKRLKLFFAKGMGLTEAEFWFVPIRKK